MSWENLEVGDKVIVSYTNLGKSLRSVAQVVNTTKTQVTVLWGRDEVRFNRRNLRQIGGDIWHCPVLEEATDEVIASVRSLNRNRNLLRKIEDKIKEERGKDTSTVSNDVLEKVASLLGVVV